MPLAVRMNFRSHSHRNYILSMGQAQGPSENSTFNFYIESKNNIDLFKDILNTLLTIK